MHFQGLQWLSAISPCWFRRIMWQLIAAERPCSASVYDEHAYLACSAPQRGCLTSRDRPLTACSISLASAACFWRVCGRRVLVFLQIKLALKLNFRWVLWSSWWLLWSGHYTVSVYVRVRVLSFWSVAPNIMSGQYLEKLDGIVAMGVLGGRAGSLRERVNYQEGCHVWVIATTMYSHMCLFILGNVTQKWKSNWLLIYLLRMSVAMTANSASYQIIKASPEWQLFVIT